MTEPEWDAYIDAASRLLSLPVTPEMKPAVRANLEVAARMAGSILDFPMDEREEPASVYAP